MLWGATLHAPHPSARIRSIDLSDAYRIPGVHAIVTADDVPGRLEYGLEHQDQPVFARDVVRYAGEPIVAVAADHPDTARRAVAAMRVEYEPLAPLTDPEAAIEAPPIHPDGNLFRHVRIRHGDPDAVGAIVVEGFYEVGMQDQAFLGPEAGLAVPDHDGAGVELYISTQWLHVDQGQVAACLALPLDTCAPDARRCRWCVRRARRREPPGARLPARVAYGPARQDDVRTRGVVLRSRTPASRADAVPAPRRSRRHNRQGGGARSCSTAAPTRRRRVPSSRTRAASRPVRTAFRTR